MGRWHPKVNARGEWVGTRGHRPRHLDVTPPRCLRPHCDRPVTRKYGVLVDAPGARVVDGFVWRWYCSRECMQVMNLERAQAAIEARSDGKWRRHILRAKDALGAKVDAHDRVALKEAVRYAVTLARGEYARGWTKGQFDERRSWRPPASIT